VVQPILLGCGFWLVVTPAATGIMLIKSMHIKMPKILFFIFLPLIVFIFHDDINMIENQLKNNLKTL